MRPAALGAWRKTLVLALVLLGCSTRALEDHAAARAEPPEPPRAAEREHVVRAHGRALRDPYAWLRDSSDPEVVRHLAAENAYSEAMLADTAELRARLYGEMRAALVETQTSAPYALGAFEYYTRTEAGLAYRIHARRPRAAPAQPETIVLDENELAREKPYFHLGGVLPSPDGRRIAYATDTRGDERYTLFVRGLDGDGAAREIARDVDVSFAWVDDETLLYLRLDDANRPYEVWRHRLGTAGSDARLFVEHDAAHYLSLERSRSARYVVLQSESAVTSEAHLLETARPSSTFQIVTPRRHGVEYRVADHGQHLYVVTNEGGAREFEVKVTDLEQPHASHWRPFLRHRPHVLVTGIDTFRDRLVILEREAGLPRVRVKRLVPPFDEERVELDEEAYDVVLGPNHDFDARALRLEYTSLVTPQSVLDYDFERRTLERVWQRPVQGYRASKYETRRVHARAPDGASVPISMVSARASAPSGPRPLLLYGYGAYGAIYEPSFDPTALPLLDRGFVVAIAHVRGGGELGRGWYEAGRRRNKKNTFVDFIAAAEHLIDAGYTTPEQLAISGASAGGLLIGAVLNLRPGLFRAAIADVPFVDLINTMLDPSLPLTVTEWDEWGNPADPLDFEYMLSYSPYDNIARQAYPELLVLAGLNDRRVSYWEPAKWVAKLRTLAEQDRWILLRTELDAGHWGASGRYAALERAALQHAFVVRRLGLE